MVDEFDVYRDRSVCSAATVANRGARRVTGAIPQGRFEIPERVRVSLGWPKGGSGTEKLGQCFSPKVSGDEFHEIFISPKLEDPVRLIGVSAHELVHATVGTEAGHRAPFRRVAVAVGLTGPMRATEESEEFAAWVRDHVLPIIGSYPASAITAPEKTRSVNRRIKCECPRCGMLVMTTRQWLEKVGAPDCHVDRVQMVVGGVTTAIEAGERVITLVRPMPEAA
jgi:hypothetical protein